MEMTIMKNNGDEFIFPWHFSKSPSVQQWYRTEEGSLSSPPDIADTCEKKYDMIWELEIFLCGIYIDRDMIHKN